MTSPGKRYNAGTIFLQVIPSYRDFQEQVGRDAKELSRALGSALDKDLQREIGDSVEGGFKAAAPHASKAGEKAAQEYGGAFNRGVVKQIDAALSKLPKVKIEADSSAADREIDQMRQRLVRLRDETINLKVDSKSAVSEISRVAGTLDRMSRVTTSLRIRSDAASAVQDLAVVGTMASKLDGKGINLDVDVDAAKALAQLAAVGEAARRAGRRGDDGANSFRAMNGVLFTTAAAGPAVVPALGAIGGGIIALLPLVVGLTAGLGVMVAGFSGIGGAVGALNDAQQNAAKDAAAAAKTQQASADRIAAAQRTLRDAEKSLQRAREDAAQSAEDASRRVAEARRNLADAETDAAADIADAVQREKDARDALAQTNERNAERTEQAARREAEARQRLADAEQEVAERTAAAARDVKDARRDLRDAERDAARDIAESLAREEDARENLARVVEDTTRDVERALKRQADAQDRLQESVRAVQEAEEDLARARVGAAEDLVDLEDDVISGALAEEAAVLALQDAERDLNAMRADPKADQLDLARREVAYRQQVQNLEELRLRNERLRAEQVAAVEAGVEGSERVQNAQEQLREALRDQTAATVALGEASQAVADARVDGARRVAEAEEALAAALDATALQREESARRIADEERDLADARAKAAKTEIENARLVGEAQTALQDAIAENARVQRENARDTEAAERRVAEAVRDVATAHTDGAASIATAAEGVDDALRAQARAAADSAQAIEDATVNVADSMDAVGRASRESFDLGSASAIKLKQEMDKLSPAGQDFARFLQGELLPALGEVRKIAQEGMLPGVQDALETLMDEYGPEFADFVRVMAETLGDLFRLTAETLTNPIWREFFATMAEYAPTFVRQFAEIMLGILTVFAQIATAFAPLAAELGDALVGLLDSFNAFLASPEGQQALQDFLAYVRDIAPEVGDFFLALGGALINLVLAIAPYGEQILAIFTGILDFIANMDPDVLGAIVIGLIGLILAFQTAVAVGSLVLGVAAIAASTVATVVAIVVAFLFAAAIAVFVFWDEIKAFFENVGDGLFDFFDGIDDAVGDFFKRIEKNLDTLSEEFHDDIEAIKGFFSGLLNFLTFDISDAWNRFNGGMERRLGDLHDQFNRDVESIKEFFRSLLDFFTFDISDAWDRFNAFMEGRLGTLHDEFSEDVESIKGFFRSLLDFFTFDISDAWDRFSASFETRMQGVTDFFGFRRDDIVTFFRNLLDFFTFDFFDGFSGAGDDIEGRIQQMTNFFKDRRDDITKFFRNLAGFFTDELPGKFQEGIDAIGRVFDTIRDKAKEPIRFVVDSVINGALIDNFNKLANFFGAPNIPRITLPPSFDATAPAPAGPGRRPGVQEYADGGVVGGWSPSKTADNIPAMLTAREFVQPVDSVDYYGVPLMEALRKRLIPREILRQVLPGYAKGGLVDFGRFLQGRGFRVSEHPSFGGVNPVHSKNSLHYSNNAIDVNWAAGTSAREQKAIDEIVPFARDYGLRTIWRTTGHFNHAHFDTGRGGNLGAIGGVVKDIVGKVTGVFAKPFEYLQDAVMPVIDGIGSSPYAGIIKAIPSRLLRMAQDKAVDLLNVFGGEASTGRDEKGGDPNQNAFAHGGLVKPIRLYDTGGKVPPGLSGILNLTGGDETAAVLTPEQLERVQGGSAGRSSGPHEIRGTLDLGNGLRGYVEGVIIDREEDAEQFENARIG